jgi:hypothetical protein
MNSMDAPDNTVSSLSQFLGDCVSLIDDEVLVEHLEHLSSLKIRHCGDCDVELCSEWGVTLVEPGSRRAGI